MKYLLIPTEEIDSRIKEIKRELYQDIKTNELNYLKSKGEIVEIQTYDAFNHANLGYGDMFCITQRKYREEGYKLIKTVK